jgi:hypothetical protein
VTRCTHMVEGSMYMRVEATIASCQNEFVSARHRTVARNINPSHPVQDVVY